MKAGRLLSARFPIQGRCQRKAASAPPLAGRSCPPQALTSGQPPWSSGRPPADAPLVATAAQKAVEQRTGSRINILQSAEFMPSTELRDTFTRAGRCLDLMRVLGRQGAICTQDELTVYAVMFAERSREELDAYIQLTIGALLEHDDKRNTLLTGTLSCYLDSGYNTGVAARALGIHENTLRQRLDSIERLLGNWRAASRCFEVQAAVKLHTLRLGLTTR